MASSFSLPLKPIFRQTNGENQKYSMQSEMSLRSNWSVHIIWYLFSREDALGFLQSLELDRQAYPASVHKMRGYFFHVPGMPLLRSQFLPAKVFPRPVLHSNLKYKHAEKTIFFVFHPG